MAEVVAVARDGEHRFSKRVVGSIRLVEGLGVDGDAHAGATVQHRSRVARDPTQPNLRQVHLIEAELLDELRDAGYDVEPGDLGENVTTRGAGLLELSAGALLRLGGDATVLITGLRNPCLQIDRFRAGMLRRVVGHADDGTVVRRAGVMGVVRSGGIVAAGDAVLIEPPRNRQPLQPV